MAYLIDTAPLAWEKSALFGNVSSTQASHQRITLRRVPTTGAYREHRWRGFARHIRANDNFTSTSFHLFTESTTQVVRAQFCDRLS
jgi:hypothetical protein